MSTPTPGGFSLFPSPNSSKPPPVTRNQTPRGRRSGSRERRAPTPQERRAPTPRSVSPEQSQPSHQTHTSPRTGRQTPLDFESSPQQETQIHAITTSPLQDVQVQQPRPTADVPGRSETGTAFSQANTLVRAPSHRSRSSIAKLPFPDETSPSPEQPLRSIFPTYNPEVSLGQQNYIPTQLSPTRIPRAVISRQTYHEGQSVKSPPIRSPLSAGSANKWPRRAQDPPIVPTVCSTEQLKNLWKVCNGWRASPSEGRVYCMKMAQEKDAPVYTLSSTNQPFYNLRLDPTSASAYVTLTKYDPSKPYKAPKPADASSSASSILSGVVGGGGSSSKATENKHWQEGLTTTLEEESRKHPPNDGLVALLMPTPATKMAIEKAQDPSAVMMAERECARLVWDEDSQNHFLVHPALATPFCITIERSPAWSRVEYTLEHHESPQHLAKLTRDGTGSGWLELDTGIASKIESFFIIDVAVTALLLVAQGDEKNSPATELFEPPPPLMLSGRQEKRLSKMSKREEKKRRKMESFEIDVESQDDSLGKGKPREAEDKLPFLIRVVIRIFKALFACFIWVLTIGFKCVAGIFKGAYRCVGSKY
ncbi:Fc.00g021760.m01.CDS01 [Cosmosporella sp. VM-42]